MKIIVGLGNPGVEYVLTRHNAGVMLVDKIFEIRQKDSDYGWRRKKDIMMAEFPDMVLVKTAGVFMNESGRMIRSLHLTPACRQAGLTPLLNSSLSAYASRAGEGKRYENLYLVHDDLDIKLGEYKIQFGKGPKEHNGVESVEKALGTKDFWRIRMGIDNRKTTIDGETYVLQKFAPDELEIVMKVAEKVIGEI